MSLKIKPYALNVSPSQLPEHWHEVVKRIYAARIQCPEEVDKGGRNVLGWEALVDADKAAYRLSQAIEAGERILIYGDYDVDGATAVALCVRVLRALGAVVEWFVPRREVHGYGLNLRGLAEIKRRGALPSVLMTVDNGIVAHEAVARANGLGIDCIITDHHLPAGSLPEALAVVNPNRLDCDFESKALAGVGVAFYVLLALRAVQLEKGLWPEALQLRSYLDLVALGTIADVAQLDYNNRILLHLGLKKMRMDSANMGIRALCAVGNVEAQYLTAQEVAFALAPRLNAIGRLGDMSEAVALLLSEDWQSAQEYAQQAEACNRKRKAIENTMLDEALLQVDERQAVLCVYDAQWHEGVLGLVAGRLKSRFSRPVVVGCDALGATHIKASVRCVEGVCAQKLLTEAAKRLGAGRLSFGGHAMAAGLTVAKEDFSLLAVHLQQAYEHLFGAREIEEVVWVDGRLPAELMQAQWAEYFSHLEPWGAGFPEPMFVNIFELLDYRMLGTQHCRLVLREPESGQVLQAVWFFHQLKYPLKGLVEVVYTLQVNRFYGDARLQLLVRHLNESPCL